MDKKQLEEGNWLREIDLDAMEEFYSDSKEKIILFSLEECAPCLVMKEDLVSLKESGQLNETAYYVSLENGPNFPKDLAAQLGIRHFPTLFCFHGEECLGVIRGAGLRPSNISTKEFLLQKITRIKEKAANAAEAI